MRLKPMSVAVACAIFVVSSAMRASPDQTTQTPGQMTQARVWIENRGKEEAVPVTLQESELDAPLRVRVVNAQANPGVDDPVYVRVVRQPRVWQYQTVIVKPGENLATALSAAGTAGWETTGIALSTAEGTTILMKRLR
jgi:hypothetical protein